MVMALAFDEAKKIWSKKRKQTPIRKGFPGLSLNFSGPAITLICLTPLSTSAMRGARIPIAPNAPALVFVRPNEGPFRLHASEQGIQALVLNFPQVKPRAIESKAPFAAAGFKK